jgi:hypothetical protein
MNQANKFVLLMLSHGSLDLRQNYDRSVPVLDYKLPNDLRDVLGLEVPDEGLGYSVLQHDFERLLQASVRTGHVRFFNQLWAGSDTAAILSEWLLAAINSSMYTYELAPAFTLWVDTQQLCLGCSLIFVFSLLQGSNSAASTFFVSLLGSRKARGHLFLEVHMQTSLQCWLQDTCMNPR